MLKHFSFQKLKCFRCSGDEKTKVHSNSALRTHFIFIHFFLLLSFDFFNSSAGNMHSLGPLALATLLHTTMTVSSLLRCDKTLALLLLPLLSLHQKKVARVISPLTSIRIVAESLATTAISSHSARWKKISVKQFVNSVRRRRPNKTISNYASLLIIIFTMKRIKLTIFSPSCALLLSPLIHLFRKSIH